MASRGGWTVSPVMMNTDTTELKATLRPYLLDTLGFNVYVRHAFCIF
jgi:hypothetical protein